MKIVDLIKYLEKQYDKNLAYDFDNPGLNVGCIDNNISSIVVCLDVTEDVIDYAIKCKSNLIISHHPIIFSKLQNVNDINIDSKKIVKLLQNNISCYSMHTNFDVKNNIGMGDIVAKKLFTASEINKSSYIENIDKKNGLGKIINLKKSMSINTILSKLVKNICIDENIIRVYTKLNKNDKKIKNIAILPGSGKSDTNTIIEKKVDMYITGDLSHNNIIDLLDYNITYLDCTHYGLEKVFIDFMSDFISKKYKNIKIYKKYNEYA